jgi:hypothetical protein
VADGLVLLAMFYILAAQVAGDAFRALAFFAPARQGIFIGKANNLAGRGSGHGGPGRFLSKMIAVFTVHRHS